MKMCQMCPNLALSMRFHVPTHFPQPLPHILLPSSPSFPNIPEPIGILSILFLISF